MTTKIFILIIILLILIRFLQIPGNIHKGNKCGMVDSGFWLILIKHLLQARFMIIATMQLIR